METSSKSPRECPCNASSGFPFAALLLVTVSSRGHAADDLSPAFNGAAFASCLNAPTRKCVLRLATQVALRAERKQDIARYLAKIAAAQAKAGLREDAEANIELALRHLDQADHSVYRDSILEDVVDGLGSLGKVDDALRLANTRASENGRAALLTMIAQQRARASGVADGPRPFAAACSS